MKILLFGVSNVGKSTVGEMLAERIGFHYYDLDDEVKRHLGITLEQFINSGNLKERDQIRGSIINHILQLNENIVFAITPISYPDPFREQIHSEDNLLIELYDTEENIFSRLVFRDENDVLYTDDDYKNEHKEYYLREIRRDQEWYGEVYRSLGIQNRLFMNNDSPSKVTDRIIAEYKLNSRED